MYIPINFLASALDCANLEISGALDDAIEIDIINSGSDNAQIQFIIPDTKSLRFNISGGSTSTAKLLLVGGGGRADQFQPDGGGSSTGGGGAGQVIFQDITLQPGVPYFISSSATGGTQANTTGGSSTFIENYVGPEVNWTKLTAVGGDGNSVANGFDGGDSGDGFSGGLGSSNEAGGGGAGSTSNGQDYQIPPGFPGQRDGGDGGDGYTIPAPYNQNIVALGTKIAGGGPGDSVDDAAGSYATGVGSDNYGNGASGDNGGNNNGNNGVACIWIPIKSCAIAPTGSIALPNPETTPFSMVGGDIVGTFTSASQDYKYHIFTSSSAEFNCTGYTNTAKCILVGAGGGGGNSTYRGGGGAGGVAIKRNLELYGTYNVTVGQGRSASNDGQDTVLSYRSNYIPNQIRAIGGGRGASFSESARTGGSGGGGSANASHLTGAGSEQPSVSSGYANYDAYFGNSGGNGDSGTSTHGGGGGAGSAGANGTAGGTGGTGYTLTGEFFPTSVLFATSSIAVGGYSYQVTGYSTQDQSGDGGGNLSSAKSGFACITYPI
jgi:hypothetical protein